MEYPMTTLITGNRSLKSLVGVAVHELVHSWYYGVIATDELSYAWMDEGFTNYVTILTMTELYKAGFLSGDHTERNFESDYKNYAALANLGIEEPMSTHANYFSTNTAYYGATYAKGCVFLAQLEYLIGTKALQNVMLRYFNTWKFKHPRPEDFICIAEDESGLVLDWYHDYWILSTKKINYRIESVQPDGNTSIVTLYRSEEMPMPLEIIAKTRRGTEFKFYLPLDLAHGVKPIEAPEWTILESWRSVNPVYTFSIPLKFAQLASIEIDPSGRMADIDRTDNVFSVIAEEE
jgi:aminopeptidase N